MQISRRVVSAVAFGLVPLLLAAGCGESSGEGARATITPIQGSSYVTIEPATTTTTTTIVLDDLQAGDVSPVEQVYTVASGDSLSRIAGLYDITVDTLVNYNGWSDGSSHLILPGDQVLIPPNTPVAGSTGGDTASGSGSSDTGGTDTGDTGDDTATGDDCPTTYVIAAGDTTRIKVADRFGITYQQMDAANANTPGYANFVVGTSITIPCP